MEDYGLDLDEVSRVIDAADVLVVRFAILDKRLLIDARTNETDGPLIAVVPRAQSVEDRFKSLKKLRPLFPLPEKIMSFMWPRSRQKIAVFAMNSGSISLHSSRTLASCSSALAPSRSRSSCAR